MPTGLKASSSVISIGFGVAETVAGTMAQSQIDLNLSPLDREVFVVLAVNIDTDFPDYTTGNTDVRAALTTTSQTTMPTLQNANCLSRINSSLRNAAGGAGVGYQSAALETPPSTLDYIGIIATNDFFVQVQGLNNAGIKGASGKMYGYRAIASADIYAALVQSEVLSA